MKPLLMIYDDERRHAEFYEKMLKRIDVVNDNYIISTIDNKKFVEIYDELKRRRKLCREKKTDDEWNQKQVDDATIFIIDYDLINACESIPENGEEISYYLRFFSKCKYIIQLNRFGYKTFDLTLNGHLTSYADINIGMEDLKNIGFWSDPSNGYRPWYWPSIVSYQKNHEKRIEFMGKNLNEPIYNCLNFEISDYYSMSQSVIEQLGLKIEDLKKSTFNDFFIKSKITLKEKDRDGKFSEEMKTNIVASRFSKWIERAIIPGQDILIDAPHLALRFPSLLTKDDEKIDSWNELCNLSKGFNIPIDHEKLNEFIFDDMILTSRPCWLWDNVSNCTDILEVNEPWKRPDINLCFAEDTSRFFDINLCREFNSNVDSQFKRRYIKYHEDEKVEYRPAIRMY